MFRVPSALEVSTLIDTAGFLLNGTGKVMSTDTVLPASLFTVNAPAWVLVLRTLNQSGRRGSFCLTIEVSNVRRICLWTKSG